MINLYTQIAIKIEDEKSGLDPKYYHKVIGTYHRKYTKDGKEEEQDFFMVARPDGTLVNVFPSKCKIKRIETVY